MNRCLGMFMVLVVVDVRCNFEGGVRFLFLIVVKFVIVVIGGNVINYGD